MKSRRTAALWCMAIIGCWLLGGCKPKETAEESQSSEQSQVSEQEKEPTRHVAGVGSGKRGRKIEKREGVGKIIVTPAVSYFRTKEKIIFDIVLPKNMQLFQATNGRYPKSHEEFMKEIIEAGMVTLPELPENSRYIYDPETHQLMVETR